MDCICWLYVSFQLCRYEVTLASFSSTWHSEQDSWAPEKLYSNRCSCVLPDGVCCEWFQVLTGVHQGCTVAPDLFLNPMDWILDRTVAHSRLGVSIGEESFTDLDYMDDVAFLAEMLDFLVAGLLVLQEEAAPLGLQINWIRTKIQQIGVPPLTLLTVQVAAENVVLVNEFVYLGSLISHERGSEAEILKRIGVARNCFSLLDKNIWKSHIHTDTKVRLYRIYILPVLLYGCKTWTITKIISKRLDAFDTRCLRKILRMSYTRHITNETVTACTPVSELVRSHCFKFFGHLACTSTTHWLEETGWMLKNNLAKNSWWRRSVPELHGVYITWRKAKDRDISQWSVLQCALTGVGHQEEEDWFS